VDEVTDSTISGGLCMASGEHEVSGDFTLDICAD